MDWGRCGCEDRGGGWLTGVGLLLCSNLKLRQSSFFLRAAPHVSVRMLLCFTAVIFFLFHFRQPNLGRLCTDLAEIWHADRKLV